MGYKRDKGLEREVWIIRLLFVYYLFILNCVHVEARMTEWECKNVIGECVVMNESVIVYME